MQLKPLEFEQSAQKLKEFTNDILDIPVSKGESVNRVPERGQRKENVERGKEEEWEGSESKGS